LYQSAHEFSKNVESSCFVVENSRLDPVFHLSFVISSSRGTKISSAQTNKHHSMKIAPWRCKLSW